MNPFDELSIEEAVRLRERKKPAVADIILAVSGRPMAAAARSSRARRTAGLARAWRPMAA